jgi:dienelactone hydrolase
VLIGSADDWTPPEPCRRLAERNAVLLIEYPGAVHAFDTPNLARRTRTGVAYSARGDGNVEIGTDPKARAAAIKEVMTILDRAFR